MFNYNIAYTEYDFTIPCPYGKGKIKFVLFK